MTQRPNILLQYNPVQTWPGTVQNSFVGATASPTVLSPGTLAYYRFQNNDLDQTANNYDLTMVGTVPYESTIVDKGSYAAGPFTTSNYFTTPAGLNTAFSNLATYVFEIEIYPIAFDPVLSAVVWSVNNTGGGSNLIQIDHTGVLTATINGQNVVSSISIVTGAWQTITVVADAVNFTVYVNGVQGGQHAKNGQTTGTVSAMYLGVFWSGPTAAFNGYINTARFKTGSTYPVVDVIPRGYLPPFRSTTAKYVSKAGSDANAGTVGSPYLTIGKALSVLSGAFVYAVVSDSGNYSEQLNWNVANTGLYAADGQAPTIKLTQGATPGTYGARPTGRTQINSLGATTLYVNQTTGNDSTGARGNPALPFKTISGALALSGRVAGDTVHITDSALYLENIAGAAKGVTIQAALGQTPTLKGTGSTQHFIMTAGANQLNLYGLSIVESSGFNFNIVGNTTNYPVSAYDCSFSGGLTAIGFNDTTNKRTFTVVNCYFERQKSTCLSFQWAATVTNCMFNNCTPSLGYVLILTGSQSGAAVSQCTFQNNVCSLENLILQPISDGTGTQTLSVSNCLFQNGSGDGLLLDSGTDGIHTDTINMTTTNCYFYNLTGRAVYYDGSPSGSSTSVTLNECVANNCRGVNFYINPATSAAITTILNNCAAIRSGSHSFQFVFTGHTLNNCVSVNPVGSAISGTGTASAVGFLSHGNSANASAGTATYSCFQNAVAGGFTLGTGSSVADPKFISLVAGSENLGLNPASPGILTGNSAGTVNMGLYGKLFRVSATGVLVNGITFDGVVNFHNGVVIDTGIQATIAHVTFANLGPIALVLASQSTSSRNLFVSCNGNGIMTAEQNTTVRYNAGYDLQGALVFQTTSASAVVNNSSYSCLYGQYDLSINTAQLTANNIYSNSAVYDYSGSGTQTYACIGTLDPNTLAAVDANSTRLNPLYRNPAGGDLRLQAIAASASTVYYFDSPAKLAGSDGQDMGAFQFTYGTLSTAWTTIDFGTPGYRNPDKVMRKITPVKLAEFTREDATTESTAVGYPVSYTFDWGNNNDMPAAQVNALIALFSSTTQRVMIDFTGTGSSYTEYAVIKSQNMEWEEMGGFGYSNDALPTPVKNMEFRQS